jgi:hypothetical protein
LRVGSQEPVVLPRPGTYDWIGDLGDHCDYPEECLASWLPTAFALAEYLWLGTVLAGVASLVLAAVSGLSRLRIVALGGALAAAFLSYCLSPMVQTTPGQPIEDYRAIEANPFFWGGPGYTLTALLMAAASLVLVGQCLRTGPSRAATDAVVLTSGAD